MLLILSLWNFKENKTLLFQDFALEPDEMRMRTASQAMARNVAAGLALITSREPMLQQLKMNIHAALQMNARGVSSQMFYWCFFSMFSPQDQVN